MEKVNELKKLVKELFNSYEYDEIKKLLTDDVLERYKDAELYAWRSKINYSLDDDIATNLFYAEKAISLDPNYFMGYYVRALIHYEREGFDKKAIKDFTKAIELNLDFAEAYYYRGLIWQNLNEKNKALADFDKAIENYEKDKKNNKKNAELYLWIGNAWYNKQKYKEAIKYYDKAIKTKKDYKLAYYNMAQVMLTQKKYEEALNNFKEVIDLDSDYAEAYISMGHVKRKINENYDEAIDDYTRAIKKDKNALYYRGLSFYNKASLKENVNDYKLREKAKNDFKKYIKLTSDETDIGVRYAKYYLKKLEEISDSELTEIKDLIIEIKNLLHIEDKSIIHYTSLSSMKELILTDKSKFRIFEGNFMNDPSEGTELFRFLFGEKKRKDLKTKGKEDFIPKPFIGSFVHKKMDNDLNMWRFYCKDDKVDAKGCAIVLRTHDLIEDIKKSLSNERNKEARIDDESNINFYSVVYLPHNSNDFKNLNLINTKLKSMMINLKEKANAYIKKEKANITSLEEYLNYIAFLFKRDDYKIENEVRLVMNGIEYEKKIYKKDNVNPPKVYIELVPIRNLVNQITIGPKVENANEWASAIHYSYKEQEKENKPKIMISHLPYK